MVNKLSVTPRSTRQSPSQGVLTARDMKGRQRHQTEKYVPESHGFCLRAYHGPTAIVEIEREDLRRGAVNGGVGQVFH